MASYSSYIITLAMIVLFVRMADLSIVLQGNGYSNILVAISKDIPQPGDGGKNLLVNLKALLTQTSVVLFKATGSKVYFKEIDILIPSSWNATSAEASITSTRSYQLADIRLTSTAKDAFAFLPHTSHSGKCGVAGDFITLPFDYVMNEEETIEVRSKGLVQQWAQLRYGVFEEHGFPDDDLLPYFYRHPDGYDAVSSSNNTEIKGDLESLSGADCEIDENGIISNQGSCRFRPNATDQTATTSLMSFHWLESVNAFSDAISNHDKRPPHRQNRLCSSRSSLEVMDNLPDFSKVTPNSTLNPNPNFQILQNKNIPVVYIAVDKSSPSNPNNTIGTPFNLFKRGLRNLFIMLSNVPDTLVAWSTFESKDSGLQSYLNEEIPPTRIGDGTDVFIAKVDNFVYSTSVDVRDVSAVIRDAEIRLRKYKDVGGSILYIVTSNESETNDTVTETNLAEKLLLNNVKLIVAESGPNFVKDLFRLSVLSQGSHYFMPQWDNTFTPINTEIQNNCGNGLKTERRMIISKKNPIKTNNPWTGSFSIDETVGRNTTIVLQSPKNGLFNIILTDPNGNLLTLKNEPEVNNWNYPDSSVKVIWQRIADTTTIGRWSYNVSYDSSSCTICDAEPEITFQIGSSIRSETSSPLSKIQPWVSLSPDLNFVDLSQHPTVIQVRFDSAEGRLGDLIATADIFLDSVFVASIPLFDTGLMDSDVSKDGIYSGIFYPETAGNYSVNFYAVHSNSIKVSDRLLTSDQKSYCCGSSLPTITLNYFQITANEAIAFEARNAPSQVTSPIVGDFQGNTYGVDKSLVYIQLKWTVPFNTMSQTVKYSENYEQLVNNCESSSEAVVVDGSLNNVVPGGSVFVYVSAPYTKGKNVYFVVEITGKNKAKSCSNLVWTERNPPEYVFTSPQPTSSTASTITTSTMSSTTANSSSTEVTDVTTETNSTSSSTSTTSTSTTTGSSTNLTSTTTPISTDATVVTAQPTTDEAQTTDGAQTTDEVQTTDGAQTTDEVPTTDGAQTTDEVPTTEVPTTTESPNDNKLTAAQIGYIVGGVIGGIVVIGAITGGVMFYKKKQIGSGNSLPAASNSNYNRAEGRDGGYSNSPYPTSTPYTSPPEVNKNNSRQPDVNKAYDNFGVTVEDDDILMTAM